ncbi:acyltransferase family protein [Streptomyces sodiiphilus]|uniref:Acyltransferase family protein n=1 Tax=Streptomyces sodiiphilus TaxID=226217 RepID=A0ABN2PVV9_9ACTN
MPTGPAAASRQRDAFFDNAKYLAIVLVAVAHAWEPLRSDSRAVTAAYMAVYAFHMPAFIIITGYFSRNADGRPERIRRLITGVAVPYVVFQVLYTFFRRWIHDDPDIPVALFDPWWVMWFLMALFIWRLTVPVWKAIRWPVPIATLIAVVASVSPSVGGDLNLMRVLQFLPFFVLGLCLKPEHFALVRRREVRLAAVPVFATAVAVAWWAAPRLRWTWFYHRESAQELGASMGTGIVMTLALFACAILLTVCFFALVPQRRTWFTVLGAGTLYGYLLHGFLIKGGVAWGWYDPTWLNGPPGAVVVSLLAAAGVTVMCSPVVRRTLRFLMEPSMSWFFRRAGSTGTRDTGGR